MSSRADREYSWLRSQFNTKPVGKGYQFPCPKCGGELGRSGFAMVLGSGKGSCLRVWCNQPSCAWGKSSSKKGISIPQMVADVAGVALASAVDALKNQRVIYKAKSNTYDGPTEDLILPKSYLPILQGRGEVGDKARAYLEGRGYDLELLNNHYHVGYTSTGNYTSREYGYLVFPFFNLHGKLVYFQKRMFIETKDKKRLRWDNPSAEKFGIGKASLLWNEMALVMQDDLVVVQEGVTDCLTIGPQATGTLGLAPSEQQLYKILTRHAKRVVLMYDEGAWLDTLLAAGDLIDKGDDEVYVCYLEKGEDDSNTLGKETTMGILKDRMFLLNSSNYFSELSAVETFGGKTYRSKSIKNRLW